MFPVAVHTPAPATGLTGVAGLETMGSEATEVGLADEVLEGVTAAPPQAAIAIVTASTDTASQRSGTSDPVMTPVLAGA
jgi:hypothetical protein